MQEPSSKPHYVCCRKCSSEFKNWNYGKRGRPPEYCSECKAPSKPRKRNSECEASSKLHKRRRKSSNEELHTVRDIQPLTCIPDCDNDEKQANRDICSAWMHGFFARGSDRFAVFRVVSFAGALSDEYKSQWDNYRSTERRMTAAWRKRVDWECVNKDRAVYESIPLKHRFGDGPQNIAKPFSRPCPPGEAFDAMNLDFTCGFGPAMRILELGLKNAWLSDPGFVTVWFDNGPRCEGKNRLFLREHKAASSQEYLENLLQEYGYDSMAKQGATAFPYKQYNKSPKADPMVMLISSSARPALRTPSEPATGENQQCRKS